MERAFTGKTEKYISLEMAIGIAETLESVGQERQLKITKSILAKFSRK